MNFSEDLCLWIYHIKFTEQAWRPCHIATGGLARLRAIQAVSVEKKCPLPGSGSPGSHTGARSGGRAHSRVPGGRAFTHGAWLGKTQTICVGLPSCRPKKDHMIWVPCGIGSGQRQGPHRPDPWSLKLALGLWNVTSLMGKEPEFVCKVEIPARYS